MAFNCIKLGRVLDNFTSEATNKEQPIMPDDLVKLLFQYTGDMNEGFSDIHRVKIKFNASKRILNWRSTDTGVESYHQEIHNEPYITYTYYCEKCCSYFNGLDSHCRSKGHQKNYKLNINYSKTTINHETIKYIKRNFKKRHNIILTSIDYSFQLTKDTNNYKQ